jgi:hypothetical protein
MLLFFSSESGIAPVSEPVVGSFVYDMSVPGVVYCGNGASRFPVCVVFDPRCGVGADCVVVGPLYLLLDDGPGASFFAVPFCVCFC